MRITWEEEWIWVGKNKGFEGNLAKQLIINNISSLVLLWTFLWELKKLLPFLPCPPNQLQRESKPPLVRQTTHTVSCIRHCCNKRGKVVPSMPLFTYVVLHVFLYNFLTSPQSPLFSFNPFFLLFPCLVGDSYPPMHSFYFIHHWRWDANVWRVCRNRRLVSALNWWKKRD